MAPPAFLKRFEVPREGTRSNRWVNNDIKPIEAERRTWTAWTFMNYWVLCNSTIATYATGSSLVALGLAWWQALISIILGYAIATFFVVLNSLPGAYYNIGFPVVNRYVWGLYGSQFVIWNRILLSIVWFGFQAYIGGQCVYACLTAIWPSLESRIPNHMAASTGITSAQFLAYVLFMIMSVPMVYIRPHKLRVFFNVCSSVIIVFEFVLLIWALATMGPNGFGSTITNSTTVAEGQLGWTIAFGIISTIGSISAAILNQNDFARFAGKPRYAILGQMFSFPLSAIITSVIGILVTAATQKRYGKPLWNLPELLLAIIQQGGSRARAAGFFSGLALVISQMGVNVPGNAISGGFDLAATFPRYINIRRGAYITLLLSIACNPWKLVSTATVFLSVLSSYSVFLGPMTGLMISSWFVIIQRKVKIEDLYVGNSSSIYWFSKGVNWRAIIAWACGTAPSLPGFVARVNPNIKVPMGLVHIYQICFLTGFAISASVYCFLHFVFPVQAVKDYVASAPAPHVLMRDYREICDSGTQFSDDTILVDEAKEA